MINKKLLKPIQNKGATKTDTPSNMVTTDTAQTITGIKTFENGIKGPVSITGDTTIDGVMLVKSDMGIIGMLSMGGSKITNLGTPQYDTDAATKKYADDGPTNMVTTDTDQTITGEKTFTKTITINGSDGKKYFFDTNTVGGLNFSAPDYIRNIVGGKSIIGFYADGYIRCFNNRIIEVRTPTANTDAANKAYVDTEIAKALKPYKEFMDTLMKNKGENYDK